MNEEKCPWCDHIGATVIPNGEKLCDNCNRTIEHLPPKKLEEKGGKRPRMTFDVWVEIEKEDRDYTNRAVVWECAYQCGREDERRPTPPEQDDEAMERMIYDRSTPYGYTKRERDAMRYACKWQASNGAICT